MEERPGKDRLLLCTVTALKGRPYYFCVLHAIIIIFIVIANNDQGLFHDVFIAVYIARSRC